MEAQTPIGNRSESGQQDFGGGGGFHHPQVAFPNYPEGAFSDYEFPSDGAEQGCILGKS